MHALVIGSDGGIGSALVQLLRTRGHRVTGTTRRRERAGEPDAVRLDLAGDKPVALPKADIAVICAGITRFEDCRSQPVLAERVNVLKSLEIARAMHAHGGRTIFLSTSAVFDCSRPFRKADDERSPRSAYGRFKAEAEERLLEIGDGVCVLRLTKVIEARKGVLAGWVEALSNGRSVEAFEDHGFCPLPLEAVTHTLAALIECEEDGILQVSGAEDISYAEAARYIAGRLGVSEQLVNGVAAVSRLPASEITPFTSLDTSRLQALTGFMAPAARAVIDRTVLSHRAGAGCLSA